MGGLPGPTLTKEFCGYIYDRWNGGVQDLALAQMGKNMESGMVLAMSAWYVTLCGSLLALSCSCCTQSRTKSLNRPSVCRFVPFCAFCVPFCAHFVCLFLRVLCTLYM